MYRPVDPWALWRTSRAGGPRRRKKRATRSTGARSKGTKKRRPSKRSASRSTSRRAKPGKLRKGSAEAKAFMARLRKMRRK